jgi:hypothetical protein
LEIETDFFEFFNILERDAFITNVFSEIWGKEFKLSCDKHCSVIVEEILRISPPSCVIKFFARLSGYYLELCYNPFGSHVLETIFCVLASSFSLIQDETFEFDSEDQSEHQTVTVESLTLGFFKVNSFLGSLFRYCFEKERKN